MADVNPYAPPRSETPAALVVTPSGYRAEGNVLFVDKGVELPDVCIFSGEPTSEGRARKKLQWAPSWLAVLIVISPLVYIIVYYLVRETGTLGFSIGRAARKRRASGIAIAAGGSILGLGAIIVSAGSGELNGMLVGFVVFLVSAVAGAMRATLYRIKRIDKTTIHLTLQPAAIRAFAERSPAE